MNEMRWAVGKTATLCALAVAWAWACGNTGESPSSGSEGQCVSDADCPEHRPWCARPFCQVCRGDFEPTCPSERPYCVFAENAVQCMPCRLDVVESCPEGE